MNKKYGLNCHRTILYFMCASLLICLFNKAHAHEISEVYIEATGNNKYESKIKAHEQGMFRSFVLLASKLDLPVTELNRVPYDDLKKVFTATNLINELSVVDKYSATVTYTYEKDKLYSLLLKYGGPDVNNKFQEFIIIPVFKKHKTLNIWDEDKRWTNYWNSARDILSAHKIIYPKKTLFLADKINSDNIFNLRHTDFTNIFNNILFKNIIIVTAEFFTDRNTSNSTMEVKKYIYRLGEPGSEIITEEYPINSSSDISYNVNRVIDQIIDKYGVLNRVDNVGSSISEETDFIYEEKEEKKPIIMNFDVFDKSELDLVISKLKKITQIDDFIIEHDYNTRYKIVIYTSVDEYELAECLYLNGLSYKIHGNLYNLIDVRKGG